MAVLKADKRLEAGTRKARKLRKEGLLPGIVYGHKKEPLSITINEHDVEMAIKHGERLLELQIGSKKENVIFKEVQYDTFGQHILHVDLARVDLHERVEVTVPVILRGSLASDEGVVNQSLSALSISCLVTAIPEDLRASIKDLNIGDSIRAGQIELPDGAELIGDPEALICTIIMVAEEEVEPVEAEEAPAEPEVIGEKKEEEGQAEES